MDMDGCVYMSGIMFYLYLFTPLFCYYFIFNRIFVSLISSSTHATNVLDVIHIFTRELLCPIMTVIVSFFHLFETHSLRCLFRKFGSEIAQLSTERS